jgi:hypothetical protein
MTQVGLSELKRWVQRALSRNDPLRLAIEAQPETLSAEDFAVLVKAWDLIAAAR